MRTYQPNPGLLSVVTLVTTLALTSASFQRSLAESPSPSPTNPNPIPMDQIGAVAGKQYSGDGLSVLATKDGAVLRCVFQRLDGEATSEGLWLKSTVTDQANDRFRVKAVAMGNQSLPERGEVSVEGGMVRFSRPGLVEEYSVSMDGVQQDFLVLAKPRSSGRESAPSKTGEEKSEPTYVGGYKSEGELRVNLAVSGARVEQSADGAQLVLEMSGRKIAYSRLKVLDANGRELPARIEVASNSALRTPHSGFAMAVVVDDVEAVYPIRIDPTFSDANWISMSGMLGVGGTLGNVADVAVDAEGSLYVGGSFKMAGSVPANYIAKWNGTNWSALGSGLNSTVSALTVLGNDLYVGGNFTLAGGISANRIAKWDGSSWSALGSGINSAPLALAAMGGEIYAGGSFTNAGGITVNRVAKWTGSNWVGLGSGVNNPVYTLLASGSNIYAGGWFTTAGGVPANRIARWDGTTWWPLGLGLNSDVTSLAASGAHIYVAGNFTNAGGIAANRIARWDGTNWSALGSGVDGNARAVAVSGGVVYVGGDFLSAGDWSASRIAKWDGSSWSALESGMGPYDGGSLWVSSLAVSGGQLFAGGQFYFAGDVPATHVARWNGTNWSGLGSGIDGTVLVSALAVSGSYVYAGGPIAFEGVTANRVARWNGSIWTAMGSSFDDRINALAVSGDDVYVGGRFAYAGNVTASRIAKWNGTNWAALGSGVNAEVRALAVSGTNLYAGGMFTSAGVIGASYIAKWNGTTWQALGSGVNSRVDALVVSGSNLYAGGYFTEAGGISANAVAKWDGSSWSNLGTGGAGLGAYPSSPIVHALAVSANNLYAGGCFNNAGGNSAHAVARWNGSYWSAMGNTAFWDGDTVSALVVSGNDVYASADDYFGINLLKWNGSSWTNLGTGVDGWVSALAVSSGNLFVGGAFTRAGDKVSPGVARAILAEGSDAVSFSASLEATNLVWTTGGNITWQSQTSTTHDGVDALQSGSISHNQESWVQATAIGPGELSFWWKVSSEAGGDFLEFHVDGLLQPGRIAGETGWQKQISTIGAGSHALRWRYVKNASVSSGQDRAWLDEVTYVPNALLFPAITQQPANQTNAPGSQASFAVTATGGAPLSFQWRKNGVNLVNGGNLSGANTTNLLIVGVGSTNAGGYSVVVSNNYGNATSSVATLTVTAPPVIVRHPVNTIRAAGLTASLNVTASGSPPISYQWIKEGTNLLNGGNISGATTPSLFVSDLQASDWGRYAVIVSNNYGSATSSVATLTVIAPRVVGHTNMTDCWSVWVAGGHAYVGSRPLRVFDVANPTNPLLLGGHTNGTYGGRIALKDNFAFVVEGSAGCEIFDVSNPSSPSPVNSIGNIGFSLLGLKINGNFAYLTDGVLGKMAAYSILNPANPVLVDDLGTLGGGGYIDTFGNVAFVVNATSLDPVGLLTVDISNPTNLTTLGICPIPGAWYVSVSGSRAAVAKSLYDFYIVDVSDLAHPSVVGHYQTLSTINDIKLVGNFAYIAGFAGIEVLDVSNPAQPTKVYTHPAENPTGVEVVGGLIYFVDPTGLTIITLDTHSELAPIITAQPPSRVVPAGSNTVFTVAVDGAPPLSYQWRFNGSPQAGATASSLPILEVQPAQAGIYDVVVTNSYGSVTSSVATLSVSVPGEMVMLGDYFPLPLNAEWLFDGTDWDGALAKTRYRVVSINTNITLYAGRSPAVAYPTNCVEVFAAYLDPNTLVAYDTWSDFMAGGGRFGQFGNDDLPSESLRVDGGVVFPAQMAVGASATNVADAYLFGSFAGVMTNVLQVLERTSLTVPAGYFPDVLHVRQTVGFPGGTQVQDQWWARSVGRIKRQGISGGGVAHHFELISYSVPIPPTIIGNDGSMGFVAGQFGFNLIGPLGQTAAVEVSTNLVNWLPLQTNTFGTGPIYFSDPGAANFPRRFYRLRAL